MEVFFFLPSGYLRYNLQHQFWAAFSRERHRISGEKEIPQIILQSVHCLSTVLHSKLKYDSYYTCNPNRCMWYHTFKNMSNNIARYWTNRNILQFYRWMHLLGNESFKLCIGQKNKSSLHVGGTDQRSVKPMTFVWMQHQVTHLHLFLSDKELKFALLLYWYDRVYFCKNPN